jgi:hypothetical protein
MLIFTFCISYSVCVYACPRAYACACKVFGMRLPAPSDKHTVHMKLLEPAHIHHTYAHIRRHIHTPTNTGVSFQMGANFSLGNLLDLKLHQYEDDVLEIVDRAQKELTIEKQLKKLADTWKNMQLSFPSELDNPDRCSSRMYVRMCACVPAYVCFVVYQILSFKMHAYTQVRTYHSHIFACKHS